MGASFSLDQLLPALSRFGPYRAGYRAPVTLPELTATAPAPSDIEVALTMPRLGLEDRTQAANRVRDINARSMANAPRALAAGALKNWTTLPGLAADLLALGTRNPLFVGADLARGANPLPLTQRSSEATDQFVGNDPSAPYAGGLELTGSLAGALLDLPLMAGASAARELGTAGTAMRSGLSRSPLLDRVATRLAPGFDRAEQIRLGLEAAKAADPGPAHSLMDLEEMITGTAQPLKAPDEMSPVERELNDALAYAQNTLSVAKRSGLHPGEQLEVAMDRLQKARTAFDRAPNADMQRVVDDYVAGMPQRPTALPEITAVDEDRARAMARVYEGLESRPDDPAVQSAYRSFVAETQKQYEALQRAGYRFEFVDEDPYKNSAEMMRDLRDNKRLKVFKSKEGDHPLLSPEENNIFRAVHDAIGHGAGGYQFGPKGEELAFRKHAAMYSPEAQRVMATETRGQNSWVNFGPNGHLPVSQRPFAQQKAALWPEEFLGDYGAMPTGAPPEAPSGLPNLRSETGRVGSKPVQRYRITHFSPREDLSVLDPKFSGTGPVMGAERKRGAKGVHVFLENTPGRYEDRFGKSSMARYEGSVDAALYDVSKDPEGIVARTLGRGSSDAAFQTALRKAGYHGYTNPEYTSGGKFKQVAVLLDKTPVKRAGARASTLQRVQKALGIDNQRGSIRMGLGQPEGQPKVLDRVGDATLSVEGDEIVMRGAGREHRIDVNSSPERIAAHWEGYLTRVPNDQPLDQGPLAWFHGSHAPALEETGISPIRPSASTERNKELDHIGRWFSGTPDQAALYGKSLYRVTDKAAPSFFRGPKMLYPVETPFLEEFLSPEWFERVMGRKPVGSEASQFLRAIPKNADARRTFWEGIRTALEKEGWGGLRWNNTTTDVFEGMKPHDMAVLFNESPVPVKKLGERQDILSPEGQLAGWEPAAKFMERLRKEIPPGQPRSGEPLFQRIARALGIDNERGAIEFSPDDRPLFGSGKSHFEPREPWDTPSDQIPERIFRVEGQLRGIEARTRARNARRGLWADATPERIAQSIERDARWKDEYTRELEGLKARLSEHGDDAAKTEMADRREAETEVESLMQRLFKKLDIDNERGSIEFSPTGRKLFGPYADAPSTLGTSAPDPRLAPSNPKVKGPNELIAGMLDNRIVKKGLLEDIEAGLRVPGTAQWYETGPLGALFEDLGMAVTPGQFINRTGSASMQNPVFNELASASALDRAMREGLSATEAAEVIQRENPGYSKPWVSKGMLANAQRAEAEGVQLPEDAGSPSRKIPFYTRGKLGGSLEDDVALDTHERRRALQLAWQSPTLRKLMKQLGLSPETDLLPIANATDYSAYSGLYRDIAKRLGLPSAQQAQAGRWVGGALKTGLKSHPSGTWLDELAKSVERTAVAKGLPTDEASLRSLFKDIVEGRVAAKPKYTKGD